MGHSHVSGLTNICVREDALWHLITVHAYKSTHSDAQDAHVRNFHVSGQTGTQITFTWDIVDGQHSFSYINGFSFFYRERNNPYNTIALIGTTFDSSNRTNEGRTFSYTITFRDYTLSGPYVMWIRVNRRFSPLYYYSKQIPVVFGGKYVCMHLFLCIWNSGTCDAFIIYATIRLGGVTMEMNIRLWPSETCYDFSVSC